MTDNNIVFIQEVSRLTRLTTPTINKYIRTQEFPRPSRIGHKKAWYRQDILDWLDAQMTASKASL